MNITIDIPAVHFTLDGLQVFGITLGIGFLIFLIIAIISDYNSFRKD